MLFMVSCIFRDLILLNIIKLQGQYLCCHVITVIIKPVLQIQGTLLQKRNKQPQKGLNSITSNIHKKMIAKHVNLKSQQEVSIVVCVICVLKNKIIIVFGLTNVQVYIITNILLFFYFYTLGYVLMAQQLELLYFWELSKRINYGMLTLELQTVQQ